MNRFSESSSGLSHFVYFHEYEAERFDEFVGVVLKRLSAEELKREQGPYSTLITAEYAGHRLVLTSGSFEGCFISIDKSEAWLAKEIIEAF